MNFIDKMAERFMKVNKRMRHWKRVVSVLSAVVVFATTYALILPAITLDVQTASTQEGMEIAASENESESGGTVYEAEPEEKPDEEDEASLDTEADTEDSEEQSVDENANENSGSENGSNESEPLEETKNEETDASDESGIDDDIQISEEAATSATTALTDLIIEDTQLIYEADEYIVYADFGESAKFPAGVELRVKEITEESDPDIYAMYYEKALGVMQDKYDESSTLSFARFYDIAFVYEDTEIEPNGNVSVRIEYKKAVAVQENTTVDTIHFDKNDDEKAEVIDSDTEGSEKKVEAVEFESDQFSVYGIVGTETITTEYISHEGTKYEVTVTYGPEAKIPEGSTLRVTDIEDGTQAYDDARNAVLADKKEKDEFVDIDDFNLAALDISIIDPNGQEIEPEAAVTVDIKIKDLPGVKNLDEIKETLEIQHHVEVPDGVVVEKVFDGSVEGSYKMDTDENIVKVGTVVDPDSVNEDDFRIKESDDEIEASFETGVFSTFTITWRQNQNNRTTTIHYGYLNGSTFVEFDAQPSPVNVTTSNRAYLIYDFEGYQYSGYTYYRTSASTTPASGGTRMRPLLRYNSGWEYRNNTGNNWTDLANNSHVYVIYEKKPDITQGGSPTLKPVNPEDYPDEPDILKESDPNGDGTADLSLSITGHTKDREVEKLADVIVVFDVSGSMSDGMSGSTRLQVAKNAVNGLVDTLAEKTDSQGNPLIRMSLISFSTSADEEIGLTDLNSAGVTAYKRAVNNLSADGGTNWDYALQLANEQAVDSGRATFVIFVTDGDPTFRNTRMNVNDATVRIYQKGNGDDYYLSDNVFGIGYGTLNENNNSLNFDAAVNQGKAIVAANKNLYSIGISNSVTAVSNFNTQSGGQGAYLANEASELNQAFDDIAASIIAMMGVSDIQMTDGITEMTQTVDKSGLTTTDGSFTYWKKAKNATTFVEWDPASEGCLEAEYDEDSGAVKWNMGTDFMPEDGATYKVTWKVWPSQDAYDILAKCMNDPSFYDTLTDAQKAQITRTGSAPNYSYSLKTNEPGAGIKYKSATKSGSGITTEGDYKDLPFNEVNPLGMASSQISIEKKWDNQLDDREVTGSYTFPVKADNVAFGDGVELSSSQNPKWTNSYYISTGLMTTNPYVVYEKGHDYTLEEPEDLSYNWDFKSDVYHPMVINNQVVNLIKVDTAAESDYTIDGKYYKALSGDAVLTATNERRSNLNISKKVVDKDGNHIESDQAFTFTVTVNEGHDADVWLSAFDTISGQTVMDSSIVTGTDVQYQSSDGYFHAPSGTTLTLTLKDGWNYRFTNLSVGSAYTIEESSPVPDGFTFEKAEATATNSATAGTVTGQKTEGTIDKSNSVYTAAYTNRANTTIIKFRKTDEDGTTPLAGAEIEIVKGSAAIEGSPFTTTTEDIELTLFDGIYRVKETASPSGYVILNGAMYFKTANGVVTITDQDGNAKVYDDFTMDTEDGVIVLILKNHPGNELPHTGGSGSLPYTLGGIALIMASALMYGFRMRRRERRLN